MLLTCSSSHSTLPTHCFLPDPDLNSPVMKWVYKQAEAHGTEAWSIQQSTETREQYGWRELTPKSCPLTSTNRRSIHVSTFTYRYIHAHILIKSIYFKIGLSDLMSLRLLFKYFEHSLLFMAICVMRPYGFRLQYAECLIIIENIITSKSIIILNLHKISHLCQSFSFKQVTQISIPEILGTFMKNSSCLWLCHCKLTYDYNQHYFFPSFSIFLLLVIKYLYT